MALCLFWAYWGFDVSSILAPIGMTPVTVRLYNLMHYGRWRRCPRDKCGIRCADIHFSAGAGTPAWWAPPMKQHFVSIEKASDWGRDCAISRCESEPGVTAVLGHSGGRKNFVANLMVGFEKPDAGKFISAITQGYHRIPLFWVPAAADYGAT